MGIEVKVAQKKKGGIEVKENNRGQNVKSENEWGRSAC